MDWGERKVMTPVAKLRIQTGALAPLATQGLFCKVIVATAHGMDRRSHCNSLLYYIRLEGEKNSANVPSEMIRRRCIAQAGANLQQVS